MGERGKDALNKLAQDSTEVEQCTTIYAGKLRRFHGKSIAWYLTQPKIIFWNTRDIVLLSIGFVEAIIRLLFWRPDVVFAKGGYVSLPVGLAAALLRVPIVIHDSDTLPGLTNRILSRYATKIGVGQPVENYPQYAKKKLVYCGVPISKAYYTQPPQEQSKKMLQIPSNSKLIAIIGGSQGAVRLNEAVVSQLDTIMQDETIYIHWICGSTHYSQLKNILGKKNYKGRVVLEQFTNELPTILNAADVAVSRTGATSLAELAALAKPTILVPNPLLTGGHQIKNGDMYKHYNAATVLSENEIRQNPALLATAVEEILNDASIRDTYRRNLERLAEPHAALKIANIIITTSGVMRKVD